MKKEIQSKTMGNAFLNGPDSQLTADFIVVDLLFDAFAETPIDPAEAITELDKLPPDFKTNEDFKTTKMVLKKIPRGKFSMGLALSKIHAIL